MNIIKDTRIKTTVSEKAEVLKEGLQPFLFCSENGTLVMQAQLPYAPFGTKNKLVLHDRMATMVSRDRGQSWRQFIHRPNEDEVNIEGGVVQLKKGEILMLDTYVVPTGKPGRGTGELWRSKDDWNSLEGPYDVDFDIPEINFYASKDDGGNPHDAGRLHRSIIELPGGDLVTLMYVWFHQDTSPSSYMPSMKKTRAILIKSSDGGNSWKYVSTIAADPGIGTEGFTEPVLARTSQGRLICIMRTGRQLYEAHSDDDGLTWSVYRPVVFEGIDIFDTIKWEGLFKGRKLSHPVMTGAMVDPDLIEMKNGVLVCAFGVRIPEKAYWVDPSYENNGNFLAFSLDQGKTWSHIVRITSGILTTHYMGIRESEPGVLYVAYDLSCWRQPGRCVMGCTVKVEV